MQPEALKFLYDIQQACELIERFTAGKSADDFRSDVQLRSAVERQFITIDEALLQALRSTPNLSDMITDTHRIINFRNVMVHGYATIVPDTIWGVIEAGLPLLHEQVSRLLNSNGNAFPA
jgi:uncharacterized protein with HEPN domain